MTSDGTVFPYGWWGEVGREHPTSLRGRKGELDRDSRLSEGPATAEGRSVLGRTATAPASSTGGGSEAGPVESGSDLPADYLPYVPSRVMVPQSS